MRTRCARRLAASAVLVAASALALPATAQTAAATRPDAITGVWLTEPGERGGRAHVEVTRDGDTFSGRIVWLEQPLFPSGPHEGEPWRDLENPDERLRERPVLGLTILTDIRHRGDGAWGGGRVYDPANGTSYSVTLTLDGDDDDTLELRGYVGIPLFGRTSVWRRVDPGARGG